MSHIKGIGCKKCGIEQAAIKNKFSQIKFIEKANKVHNNKYDYSKTKYKTMNTKIKIICKKHGVFKQRPADHLNQKQGCPKCRIGIAAKNKIKTAKKNFIKKANIIHDYKYDYSKTKYKNVRKTIIITCPEHGDFEQVPNHHLNGNGCQKCAANGLSKGEDELASYIESLGEKVIRSDRSIINPQELDIVLPDHKLAFEYNGLYWHSEANGKDRYYHKEKTDACTNAGYRLIHIFEDDWEKNKDKIKLFIKHLVGKNDSKRIYARKCTVKLIDNKVGRIFLDKHHIQGSGKGSIYFGLYDECKLVSVTAFTKGKSNTKNKDMYELSRHATKGIVIGALGKAVKHFQRLYNTAIYTFCDLSYFDGKSYEAAGFNKVGEIVPDYKYVVGSERQHKFLWRVKNIKEKLGLEGGTEKEMMEEAGLPRIWDCGKVRYELH